MATTHDDDGEGEKRAPPPGAPAADPLLGETIAGRYLVEDLIAEGGMARVYVGTDLHLGRRCAVKVARKDAFAQRLEREAFLGARFRGGGMVEVWDNDLLDDQHTRFVVFELLDGETLGECLRQLERLPWREAVEIVRNAAAALAPLHAAGLVHRDLKPDNVFLCESGEVKLLDWGVALWRGTRPLAWRGPLLGTPLYMPPEQALSPDAVDGRADVFALGAVLRHAIAGRAALPPAETVRRVLARVFDDIRAHAPDVPALVADAIARATAAARDERPRDAAELQSLLDACLAAAGDNIDNADNADDAYAIDDIDSVDDFDNADNADNAEAADAGAAPGDVTCTDRPTRTPDRP